MGEEAVIREALRLLSLAGQTKDWVLANQYRAKAIQILKDNLHLIKYVNKAQLLARLRALGFATYEVQKIIRGFALLEGAAAASGGVAATAGTIVMFGVELTFLQAAAVVIIIAAIVLGCLYIAAKGFYYGYKDYIEPFFNSYQPDAPNLPRVSPGNL